MSSVDIIHAVSSANGLAGMVDQLKGWHRFATVLSALVQHGLITGIAVALTDFINPAYTRWALTIAVAWLLAVSVYAYFCASLKTERVDRELDLHDGLTTWLGLNSAPHEEAAAEAKLQPMVDWLERDLDSRLAHVPSPKLRWLGLRRLGLLRYLIPLLVVLFLLRQFAYWLPPLPQGVVSLASEGAGEGPGGGGGSGSGGENQTAGSAASDDPDQKPDEKSEDPSGEPDEKPESPPEDEPEPPPKGGENKPAEPDGERDELGREHELLDLKTEDSFSIPQFIGAGPSTKEEAIVAKQVVGEGESPEPNAAAKSGATEDEPEVEELEFERAKERALRSRHVPDSEKAIVRTYFRSLAESRR